LKVSPESDPIPTSRRKVMKRVLVLALVAVFVCGIASLTFAAAPEPIVIKYSQLVSPGQKVYEKEKAYAAELEKRTNGRVKLEMYPGSTLSPLPFVYNALLDGIADMGQFILAYSRGTFPLSEVIDLPLGSQSASVAMGFVNGWYRKFQPKEMEQLKVLTLTAFGPTVLHTKKPVNNFSDLKGMKIRTSGLGEKIVSGLGAIPVNLPMTEAYDATQKGVTDGILTAMETLLTWRFGEVVKYSTPLYGASNTGCVTVAMSKKKWDSLPADIRQIWDELNEDWIKSLGKYYDDLDDEGLAFAKSKGLKLLAFSKEDQARCRQAVKPVIDDYVKRMKAKGLPGEESVKYCLDYIEAHQK
jgi:TRAP-type C4-dicarboxylate transport system substrate-binding protein